jgi:hypothetical protein
LQPETTETRDTLEEVFRDIWPRLTERERRLFAASEARKWGYGGISLVSGICGLSRATISKGLRELDAPPIAENRIRRPGAGRPNLVKSDPEITALLEARISGGTPVLLPHAAFPPGPGHAAVWTGPPRPAGEDTDAWEGAETSGDTSVKPGEFAGASREPAVSQGEGVESSGETSVSSGEVDESSGQTSVKPGEVAGAFWETDESPVDPSSSPSEGGEVSGEGIANSGDGAVASLEAAANSRDGAVASGEAVASSGEGAEASGEAVASSGEGAEASGEVDGSSAETSSSSGEVAEASGGTASPGEVAEASGEVPSSPGEVAEASGEGSASSEEVAEASGEGTANSSEVAEASGEAAASPEGGAEVSGDSTAASGGGAGASVPGTAFNGRLVAPPAEPSPVSGEAAPSDPHGSAGPPPAQPGPALSWTLKSTRTLARELSDAKHPISYVKVGQILKDLGYSLKGNKKTGKERSIPDSESQYRVLDTEARAAALSGMPLVHLESRSARGEGFDVSAAVTERTGSDPGAFAAGLIARWWEAEGRSLYPAAGGALVTVYDSPGGLFAGEEAGKGLAELAAGLGVPVKVLFFPAGTHRWNYPARELYSFLTPPMGNAVPRRCVVKATLVAPAGPAAGWTPESYSMEPVPSVAQRDDQSPRETAHGRDGAPGFRESAARARDRAGDWGFVVEP